MTDHSIKDLVHYVEMLIISILWKNDLNRTIAFIELRIKSLLIS